MNEYVSVSCLYTVYHSQIQCFLLADDEHYRVGSFCPEKSLQLPLLCSQRLVMSYAASNSALHYSDLKSLQCFVAGPVEDPENAWGRVLHPFHSLEMPPERSDDPGRLLGAGMCVKAF